jgi:hypothetical protein
MWWKGAEIDMCVGGVCMCVCGGGDGVCVCVYV